VIVDLVYMYIIPALKMSMEVYVPVQLLLLRSRAKLLLKWLQLFFKPEKQQQTSRHTHMCTCP